MKHVTHIHQSVTAFLRATLTTKLALVAITLLAAAAGARAEVFIYRGLDRVKSDVTTPNPFFPAANVYVVIDYDQQQVGVVVFKKDPAKKFSKGAPGPFDLAKAPLNKGKTASVLVLSLTSQTSQADFTHAMLYLRGTDATLTSRTAPSPLHSIHPRVISGTILNGYATAGKGGFAEQRYGIALDAALTISANNSNQTIQQALDALAQSLQAKGFTPL